MGQAKPSKAMVLASAIEYIRRVERERDALKEENERLRLRFGMGSGAGAGESGASEEWRANEVLDEFLMDP